MVPVELSLSNFLSYGVEPQTLDFSQFHVACLSGKNGQGKSALLDAITWVLWGEARKSTGGHKPDEELLRTGARRMKVELVFDVEEVRYRVMRAYSRSATGKTSKAEMEMQVLNADSGEGRPMTRASIRETQAYLNEILGLDYHTFINSAFLLQGTVGRVYQKRNPASEKISWGASSIWKSMTAWRPWRVINNGSSSMKSTSTNVRWNVWPWLWSPSRCGKKRLPALRLI